MYKIQVKDGNGDNLGEFIDFKNLKFGKRLNNYGACSFSVPVNSEKAEQLIALRIYSVWIWREDLLVWSGEQVSREGELDENGNNWVTIFCYDWLELLFSRYTAENQNYVATDAGAIAWDLIDVTQTETDGDFGITEGAIEATMNRDRSYDSHNIGEMIVNLTNVINGFDCEISNSKVFNVYTSMGIDRSAEIILEYGVNISSMRITEDFSKPVNRGIIIGTNGNSIDPLRTDTDDTALQAIYKLREGLSNEMTVSETATMTEKGQAMIRQLGSALMKISMKMVRLSPTIADFALGDIIRLKVQNGIYDIDRKFRIFEWTLTYNDDNTETVDLVLGEFTIEEGS